MLRKGMRMREKIIRFSKRCINKNDKEKLRVIQKTQKQATHSIKISRDFEQRMLKEAKRSLRQGTLSFFVAKRLQNIVEQINRCVTYVADYYKIKYEDRSALKKRMWRLKTLKKQNTLSNHSNQKSESSKKRAKYK